jgi:hypothetical protein
LKHDKALLASGVIELSNISITMEIWNQKQSSKP